MKIWARVSSVMLTFFALTAFGCSQSGLLDDILTSGQYLISVAPGAVNKVFADKTSANEQQTVTIWTVGNQRPVVRIDDPAITDSITTMGGSVVDDAALLDKLGVPSLRAWNFQMPASNVTLALASNIQDDSNAFLKSLKIETAVEGGEGSPVHSIGAPTPAIDEFQVPANTAFKIYLSYAKGAAISYKIGNGIETTLITEDEGQGVFGVPAITDGDSLQVEVYAKRSDSEKLTYTYILNTRPPVASSEAGLTLLETKNTAKSFLKKEEAPASGQTFEYTVENDIAGVDIVAIAKHARAGLTLNGGVIVSNIPEPVMLTKVGTGPENVNNFKVVVRAEDGTTSHDTIAITRKQNSNSALASLDIHEISDYGFLASKYEYDLKSSKLRSVQTVVRITPKVADLNSKLYFNNGLVVSGVTQNFPLPNTGDTENKVEIKVKAQNGNEQMYTLKLYREENNGETQDSSAATPILENIVLKNPSVSGFSFNKNTFVYDITSPIVESSITVVPTVAAKDVENLAILVDTDIVNSGADTLVNLPNTGTTPNIITVSVGNPNGVMKLYQIKIYRAPETNARLKTLALTSPAVSVSLNPDGGTYEVDVPNEAGSITITAEPEDPSATMTLNTRSMPAKEAQIYSFTGYGAENASDAVIVVTAQDGTTTTTHKLKITRKTGSNADLKTITVNGGDLIMTGFNPATVLYSLNTQAMPLDNRVRQISVTPTAKSATSSITINGQAVASGASFAWDLQADNSVPALENKLNIVVTAQDNTTSKTYTLKVWRARNSGDNALLKSITTSVDTKIDYGARVYPRIIPGVTEYKLYAPEFKNKTITISATPEDPDAFFEVVNGTVAFAEEPKAGWGYWDEVPLEPPIEIIVTAVDGTTKKKYTITHVVLTPGKEWGKTPMAKGGTITFLDEGGVKARDELHVWSTDQKASMESNLLFLGGTPASLPPTGWVLVHGGGGRGGAPSYEYSAHKGGGGGGGAGAMVENKAFPLMEYDYNVYVGKGGIQSSVSDSSGFLKGEDGDRSKFASIVAKGGGGGYDGNDQERKVSSHIGELTLYADGVTFHDTDTDTTDGGGEGQYSSYWDLATALGSSAAASVVAALEAYVIVFGLMNEHVFPAPFKYVSSSVRLAAIGKAAIAPIFVCASVAWWGHGVGAAGGGGAKTKGSKGEHTKNRTADGGSGGSGLTSAITGTSYEYGKGGTGGSSYSTGAKNGQGGNTELITETDHEKDAYQHGGNGKVIFRAVWK
ncbi:MAG: cadherin-like beta sandwich domain-containing protein [Spirochaetaceae bacterium]|jgi:hypothetical protein|nr:cadherin-like beta sandwich domain-containing protein [Spirochaetaceae bacterium]